MLWVTSNVIIVVLTVIQITIGDRDYSSFREIFERWLYDVNMEYLNFSQISANLSWQQTTDPKRENVEIINKLAASKVDWLNHVCGLVNTKIFLNGILYEHQERQLYLLCRGSNYTKDEISDLIEIQTAMYGTYITTEICMENSTCYKGEPELENLMSSKDYNKELLEWAWDEWHTNVGIEIGKLYPKLVSVLNKGAKRQHYFDIGEVWKEELEIADWKNTFDEIYKPFQKLYENLHAVIRYALWNKYGSDIIDVHGTIPEHLLGNMWGQDWGSLLHLIVGENKFNLDRKIREKNWSPKEMVRKAEDFYVSMGLPEMTEKFWMYSKFDTKNNSACHGTAANMFTGDDYRILMCLDQTLSDFYVIHHEMGHIEYYMHYAHQRPLFQEGANSGFQEAIGDSIMLGVMSPFHLHRLGLINDTELGSNDFNTILLLFQALTKIPQIPYAYMIDYYRWNIFNGNIKAEEYNLHFWEINASLRGISPAKLNERLDSKYFDAGAKFHVADNTPYIRYFFSYIIQFQIFKGMCDIAVFGKPMSDLSLEEEQVPFELNRCDIYGSKTAGKKLSEFLSYGSSKDWTKILPIITGTNRLSVEPLLLYFKPIGDWLESQIFEHDIPVGW